MGHIKLSKWVIPETIWYVIKLVDFQQKWFLFFFCQIHLVNTMYLRVEILVYRIDCSSAVVCSEHSMWWCQLAVNTLFPEHFWLRKSNFQFTLCWLIITGYFGGQSSHLLELPISELHKKSRVFTVNKIFIQSVNHSFFFSFLVRW